MSGVKIGGRRNLFDDMARDLSSIPILVLSGMCPNSSLIGKYNNSTERNLDKEEFK